jgi:hypothetical protein
LNGSALGDGIDWMIRKTALLSAASVFRRLPVSVIISTWGQFVPRNAASSRSRLGNLSDLYYPSTLRQHPLLRNTISLFPRPNGCGLSCLEIAELFPSIRAEYYDIILTITLLHHVLSRVQLYKDTKLQQIGRPNGV